jgi:hypothetical protein
MRRALPWLVVGLAAALVETGIAVFAAANNSGPMDYGWSAYAPLQPTTNAPETVTFVDGGTVLWTGQHLLGAGLLVLGLLLLTGVGGWLLGRRAGRRTTSPA